MMKQENMIPIFLFSLWTAVDCCGLLWTILISVISDRFFDVLARAWQYIKTIIYILRIISYVYSYIEIYV